MIGKNSKFGKVIRAIKDNPKIIGKIVLMDIAFFAIFYGINLLIGLIVPTDPGFMTRVQGETLLLLGFILLIIVYFLVMILAYSFFSLLILGNIKSISSKHEHDFSMFKRMFGLNILVFLLFFILLMVFNIIRDLLPALKGCFATLPLRSRAGLPVKV